jgi:hypothetical protein
MRLSSSSDARVIKGRSLLAGTLLALAAAALGCGTWRRPEPPAPLLTEWPAITSSARPWAIWWWPGSAVEEREIEAHLARYAAAGLGGVHVVPIYGVRGAEDRALPFLSPRWLDHLRFTVRAARARGLGVDLSTGTGWPFGGPPVPAADGSRRASVTRLVPGPDGRLDQPVQAAGDPGASLRALMAHPPQGPPLDLTARVNGSTGRLDWVAPAAGWELFALHDAPTGMKVKRAAPGGEGLVVDQLSPGALPRYLGWFDRAFAAGGPPGVRAFTSDSFEDMRSDFTTDFLAAFAARRGYDLRGHLPALAGRGDGEVAGRVRADYRETVSDLLLERFVQPWVTWSHAQGSRSRNQAHGSPANLLDLYAAADIPETEAFGPSHFPIPGLHTEPNLPPHFGKPDTLFSKLASSAAHLAGRPLVSAESATWLGEHFQVAPSQVKPELDRLFLAGVNHVFLHGVTYSPADAPWPGWLFYASTDFGPESGFARAMPALSDYVARTQALLQATLPDRDLLLYFPMHDLWQSPAGGSGGDAGPRLLHLTAHDVGRWLHQHPSGLGRVAGDLLARGVMFDFVSDRLLAQIDGAAAGTTILVPGARLMPLPTWDRLRRLAEAGATVLFAGNLPQDVPGLGGLDARRSRLRADLAALGPGDAVAGATGVRRWQLGRGRFLLAPDARSALAAAGVRREPVADLGLSVLRQRASGSDAGGHLYFLANLGSRPFEGWAPLATPAAAAVVMDALSGQRGLGELRPATGAGAGPELFLQLAPGASLLVRTLARPARAEAPRWRWPRPTGELVPLPGPWQVTFLRGGPTLPGPVRADGPAPWTTLADPALRAFSGTAVYRTEVTLPDPPAGGALLELAAVHAVAAVRVNGHEAGLLWSLPFRIDVARHLRPGRNVLELEVSSLPANRVAALARAGAPRVRYHDIDFVDIRYRPFDPGGWSPLPSGIAGPAQLRRMGFR